MKSALRSYRTRFVVNIVLGSSCETPLRSLGGQLTPSGSIQSARKHCFPCQSIIPKLSSTRLTIPDCRACQQVYTSTFLRESWGLDKWAKSGGSRSLEWQFEAPVVPLSRRLLVALKRISWEILIELSALRSYRLTRSWNLPHPPKSFQWLFSETLGHIPAHNCH